MNYGERNAKENEKEKKNLKLKLRFGKTIWPSSLKNPRAGSSLE